jgi:hypothetical protein
LKVTKKDYELLAEAFSDVADVRRVQALNALGGSQHSQFYIAQLVLDSIAAAFDIATNEADD